MGKTSDGAVEGGGVKGSERRWMLAENVRRCLTGQWRAEGSWEGLGERGESAVLQSGNVAHSPDWRHSPHHRGGIRRLPVSKLPASVGSLPVALLIVVQQFDCSC